MAWLRGRKGHLTAENAGGTRRKPDFFFSALLYVLCGKVLAEWDSPKLGPIWHNDSDGPRDERRMLVEALKTVVKNGRIDLATPADWPDGCEVVIEPVPAGADKIGIDESEWRDPASIADWDAWIKTIEPLEFTPEEEAAIARFNDEMRHFNLEAVRRQMQEGP
jgi:hypothetical protein